KLSQCGRKSMPRNSIVAVAISLCLLIAGGTALIWWKVGRRAVATEVSTKSVSAHQAYLDTKHKYASGIPFQPDAERAVEAVWRANEIDMTLNGKEMCEVVVYLTQSHVKNGRFLDAHRVLQGAIANRLVAPLSLRSCVTEEVRVFLESSYKNDTKIRD